MEHRNATLPDCRRIQRSRRAGNERFYAGSYLVDTELSGSSALVAWERSTGQTTRI